MVIRRLRVLLLSIILTAMPIMGMADGSFPARLFNLTYTFTIERFLEMAGGEIDSIVYLTDAERDKSAVLINRLGRLLNGSGEAIHSMKLTQFVVTMDGELLVNAPEIERAVKARAPMKDIFHSSFTRGDAVRMAGEMTLENGQIKLITNFSGHYMPRSVHAIQEFVRSLAKAGADLTKANIRIVVPVGNYSGASLIATNTTAVNLLKIKLGPSSTGVDMLSNLLAVETDRQSRAKYIVQRYLLSKEIRSSDLEEMKMYAEADSDNFYSLLSNFETSFVTFNPLEQSIFVELLDQFEGAVNRTPSPRFFLRACERSLMG